MGVDPDGIDAISGDLTDGIAAHDRLHPGNRTCAGEPGGHSNTVATRRRRHLALSRLRGRTAQEPVAPRAL